MVSGSRCGWNLPHFRTGQARPWLIPNVMKVRLSCLLETGAVTYVPLDGIAVRRSIHDTNAPETYIRFSLKCEKRYISTTSFSSTTSLISNLSLTSSTYTQASRNSPSRTLSRWGSSRRKRLAVRTGRVVPRKGRGSRGDVHDTEQSVDRENKNGRSAMVMG